MFQNCPATPFTLLDQTSSPASPVMNYHPALYFHLKLTPLNLKHIHYSICYSISLHVYYVFCVLYL